MFQSEFTVLAPVAAGRVAALRVLLLTMNRPDGVADAENALIPFGRFDRLHFSRLVILEDPTLGDITTAYGVPAPALPTYLAILGDVDGPADAFLADFARRAGNGLRRIFAHCDGFADGADLLRYMKDRLHPAQTLYVNWRSRTVVRAREDAALRESLVAWLATRRDGLDGKPPAAIHREVAAFVEGEKAAGRLKLTEDEPTPFGHKLADVLHLVFVPLLVLALTPLFLLYLPIFLIQLRRRERRDPEIVPRPDPAHVRKLATIEDHLVTNQFTALGSLKPGLFRRALMTVILFLTSYATRHFYVRGRLTRVQTIHFARWVYFDDKRRLLFASNYDGSLESYMDDFINKVAWGLNAVFTNGVGYPRTDWLVVGGAKDEQKFKDYIRRHQLPTEVWYDAHAPRTTFDLARNAAVREGIEKRSMSDEEARRWLTLL